MRVFILSAMAVLLTMAAPAEGQGQKRVALVIGNDAYQSLTRLYNPRLDAGRLSGVLAVNGFDVISCDGKTPGCFDLTRDGLEDALKTLRAKAKDAELAFVFYAGHGMEGADGNVLAPVDMDLDCADKSMRRAVLLQDLFKAVAAARQKIVILDACRNDALAEKCPAARGFEPVSFGRFDVPSAESLMLVSSTLPGKLASDGLEGQHSPFARALFEWLEKAPGLHFRDLLQLNVAKTVMESTSRGGIRPQIPETVVRGTAPQACLKGADCEDHSGSAELRQQVEALKRELALNVELAEGARVHLAELEKKYGRPLTEEERRGALGAYREIGRDMAARHDTRGDEALRQMKAGKTAEAAKLLEEQLAAREREAAVQEAAKRREAAKPARQLAELWKPKDVAKAASYYKKAAEHDPADAQTWLDYAHAALAAGRTDDAKAAFEQAAARAASGKNPLVRFSAMLGLGTLAIIQHSLPDARRLYEAARAMAEEAAEADPGNVEWQRQLSGSHEWIGGVLQGQGDLPAALTSYRAALAITERLAKDDPGNVKLQTDRASSERLISAVLAQQGKLSEALESVNASHAIYDRLAKADPGDDNLQSDLAASHMTKGLLLVQQGLFQQGTFQSALESFNRADAAYGRLVKADSSNILREYDLSLARVFVSLTQVLQGEPLALESTKTALATTERLAKTGGSYASLMHILALGVVGVALVQRDNPPMAVETFKAALAITERLAQSDLSNVMWQGQLSGLQIAIADALYQQRKLSAALKSSMDGLAIAERLARNDPTNVLWRGFQFSAHTTIGDVLRDQGKLSAALLSYRAALAITERLAKDDPDNTDWQRFVTDSLSNIAGALQAKGDRAGALANYRKALAIAEDAELRGRNTPGASMAQLMAEVAWRALFVRDFAKALAVSERARALAPDLILLDRDRAHALLFLKRTREAKALYLAHKGKTAGDKTWEKTITDDFVELRKAGLVHPMMAQIETALGVAPRPAAK